MIQTMTATIAQNINNPCTKWKYILDPIISNDTVYIDIGSYSINHRLSVSHGADSNSNISEYCTIIGSGMNKTRSKASTNVSYFVSFDAYIYDGKP